MRIKNLISLFLFIFLFFIGCSKTSSRNETKTTQVNVPTKAKLEIFNHIDKTRMLLSKNGIGQLSPWKSDQMGGFFSITPYYSFGNRNPKNNIAYYLESERPNFIQRLKLVLNLNNSTDKKIALAKLKDLTIATLKSLSLEVPQGLLISLDKEKEFENSNEKFSIFLKHIKTKIETWMLIIETK